METAREPVTPHGVLLEMVSQARVMAAAAICREDTGSAELTLTPLDTSPEPAA